MERIVLCAIALSMLALPISQANAGPGSQQSRYEQQQNIWKKKPGYAKPGYDRKVTVKKKHWVRGERVPSWQRKQAVRDYNRYGLRRPGHGQQWVRVDNDLLLISIASGLIGGIIAGQY